MPQPESGSFRYKVLTGRNGDASHQGVARALSEGYELCGSPAVTFDGKDAIIAQAVFSPSPNDRTRAPRTESER